ncbi:hypothetical protein CPB83DRAFT_864794 [Crepidotus variabilis]|uniref:Uncharacterized protein n=1 Tax=Crepidotus variabilis TaxID=179855 RepID=A0A9P6E491_9AGAR|nr:hypothetical protein CPB83DRAFT_864794 [Crepidotus variabilis]
MCIRSLSVRPTHVRFIICLRPAMFYLAELLPFGFMASRVLRIWIFELRVIIFSGFFLFISSMYLS